MWSSTWLLREALEYSSITRLKLLVGSFIGFWSGTARPQTLNTDYFMFGASASNYNICSQIEVTVFGSNTTTTTSTQPGATAYPWVFWEAYSYNGKGGWSGYFVLAP